MTMLARAIAEQRSKWTGKWCWVEPLANAWNTYAYFRKSITLSTSPRRATVRISADARYTLFVNGQRVHQGPARSFPTHQSYDTLDLADLLRPGINVLGVIVHQFGAPTFQTVYRNASGLLVDGVVETAGEPVPLHTADGWLCRAARGWRQTVARNTIQLGFQEHFDADADPPNWLAADYDASEQAGWSACKVLGGVGIHPWLLMEPRGVPLLADHIVNPSALIAQFTGEDPRGFKVAENVYALVDASNLKRVDTLLDQPEAMLHDDDTVTTVPAADGTFAAVTIDLGPYRTGHLVLEIAQAAGDEIIDVLFCEHLEKTQIPLLQTGLQASREAQSLRYRCRPGPQRWEAFNMLGARYLLVAFRNVEKSPVPLQIRRIAMRVVGAGVEQVGSFKCSDDRLNKIWEMGRETQRNCLFDAFVDCPGRELAMWWGDARVQARVTTHLFGDISILERGIRLMARSQTPDGALHAHPPADKPFHRLPDFMLTWIGSLWDHYAYTGKLHLVRECLPTLHQLLEFFQSHESPEGLIGGFDGYWMFLDWVNLFKGDFSAPFNLLYLQGLRWAAALCKLAGDSAHEEDYLKRAARLQPAIEQAFWDEEAKAFRDGRDAGTGKQTDGISQHSNTLAILLDLKPEMHPQIAKNVLLKSAAARKTKILTASPFFYAYVLEALFKAGLCSEALDIIKNKWGTFLDRGAVTFWELWDCTYESRCHAWSASPVHLLMEQVLGVQPTSPGWSTILIQPLMASLESAQGVVPTPLGLVRVDWEHADDDQLAMRIEIPPGMTADFISPTGQHRELEPGSHEFHT